MPTYDYRCASCGHVLEVFQSISEPPKKKCPKCGKPKLERLIGAGAGFLFKGGGFYQTDYRSDSYKKAESADKSASSPEPSTASKSPDASTPSPSTDATSAKGAAAPAKPSTPKAPSPPARSGDKPPKRDEG